MAHRYNTRSGVCCSAVATQADRIEKEATFCGVLCSGKCKGLSKHIDIILVGQEHKPIKVQVCCSENFNAVVSFYTKYFYNKCIWQQNSPTIYPIFDGQRIPLYLTLKYLNLQQNDQIDMMQEHFGG